MTCELHSYEFFNFARDASLRRENALAFLREVKSEQLNSSSSESKRDEANESDNRMMEQRVQDATKAYETALKEELNLRTIIPGVRIVAPNDAARREEDIAAAKQFLGWDILADEKKFNENNDTEATISEVNDEEKKKNLLMQSRRRFDVQESDSSSPRQQSSEEKPMSNVAKAILLSVAVSQIGLLFLLSLDPMSANNFFTNVAGSSTESLPLSSWTK